MGKQKTTATKPRQVVVSEHALRNIDELTHYIAFVNNEPMSAIRVGDRIMETMERIALNPLAFQECQELQTKSKMYRRAICLAWQIIYKITLTEIIILGVIHTSRKPSYIKPLRKIK